MGSLSLVVIDRSGRVKVHLAGGAIKRAAAGADGTVETLMSLLQSEISSDCYFWQVTKDGDGTEGVRYQLHAASDHVVHMCVDRP